MARRPAQAARGKIRHCRWGLDPWRRPATDVAHRARLKSPERAALARSEREQGVHIAMSRVLVTGAAGNIGRAVTRRLLADGRFELRASDQREIDPAIADSTDTEIHRGDLRDVAEARKAIEGCSHVIHLAAIVGGIGNFNTLPYTLAEMNSALCTAVYRAAIDTDIERFVYVSSSMVYERATVFPTPEDYLPDCPTPDSAYGFSKLTGEIYARAAHEEFGLPFTICRPGNAYGPGELPSEEPGITHVIPDLFGKVLAGQRPLQIF